MTEHTEIQVNPKHPRYLGIENVLSMIVPDTHIFVVYRVTIKAQTPDDVQVWVGPGGFYGLMTYEDYARWPYMHVQALQNRHLAHFENSTMLTRPIKLFTAEAKAEALKS